MPLKTSPALSLRESETTEANTTPTRHCEALQKPKLSTQNNGQTDCHEVVPTSRNDELESIEWREFSCEELFFVRSNPQLNKESFKFSKNAPYPYFTRTCLNNGIAGYVEYLDEEHKIKGNSIAVGMLGMQFFYMQKDFYAGQFTKTLYPKFKGLNATLAQYFITWFNKSQRVFQGVLVRDFEKVFYQTKILLPILPTQTERNDKTINFSFIESFIKAIEKQHIKSLYTFWETKIKAYNTVTNRDKPHTQTR